MKSLVRYLPRVLGVASFASIALLVVLALFVVPPDKLQGDYARLIYLHPAMAWTCYTAVGVCAASSVLYLFPRTRSMFWDTLAGASGEIGLVFCGLALATGSIWGRPVWGVWWTWDPRLTTTALLFALLVGYLAVRRIEGRDHARAVRNSVVALIAGINVMIVHFSVEFWRGLHQSRTLLRPEPTIDGIQLLTMMWSVVAFSVFFAWLLFHRYQTANMQRQIAVIELDAAINARRNENKNAEALS